MLKVVFSQITVLIRIPFFIFNESFRLVSTTYSYRPDQLVMVYYFYQVITQSDLGENELYIQPLLHGIILRQFN